MTWRMLSCLLSLAVAACGTATPYQPADPEFGYTEQQLEADRFRITFRGNSLTPRETVENYLLLRAAELTLERGHRHFAMAQRSVEASTSYVYAFHDFPRHGYYRLYPHGHRVGTGSLASAWPSTSYEAVAEIVMLDEQARTGEVDVFDARELARYLRPAAHPPGGG